MAAREILVYLVKLLRNFDVTLDGEPADMEGVSTNLNAPHPYSVKLKDRFINKAEQ